MGNKIIEEGDVVEVKLTNDDWWVEAKVVNVMETRVIVELKTPIVVVEKTKTSISDLVKIFREEEAWRKAEKIIVPLGIVREKATS